MIARAENGLAYGEGDLQWFTGRKAFTPWHQQTGLEILEGSYHIYHRIWGGHVTMFISHLFLTCSYFCQGILQFIKHGPYILR